MSLIQEILSFLNSSLWRRFIVCFGRVNKTKKRFYANYAGASHKNTKRRGGGFIIWLNYKNKKLDHRNAARAMLSDYQKEIGDVKTKVINPSLDLLFLVNGKWVTFRKLFPFNIRELNCSRKEVQGWINSWEVILGWNNILHLPKPISRNLLDERVGGIQNLDPCKKSSSSSVNSFLL